MDPHQQNINELRYDLIKVFYELWAYLATKYPSDFDPHNTLITPPCNSGLYLQIHHQISDLDSRLSLLERRDDHRVNHL